MGLGPTAGAGGLGPPQITQMQEQGVLGWQPGLWELELSSAATTDKRAPQAGRRAGVSHTFQPTLHARDVITHPCLKLPDAS